MNVDTGEWSALTERLAVLEARVGALSDGLALAGRAAGVELVPQPRPGGRHERPRPLHLRLVAGEEQPS